MKKHCVPAILLAALSLLSGCAGNPATGGASVVLSSRSGEASLGQEMHDKMVDEGAIYQDKALHQYVNRVGQRLVDSSDEPDMTFTFNVIDSPDINAFALPGGFIYINRGLLAYLDNEAELAGVLGHEIGHVTARHHGRQKTAGVTNTVMATTVYILTGSGDLASASNMYGAELISGYGRDMELEADGLGAQYMYLSGYDTESLLEVIGVLKDQERFQRVQAKSSGKPAGTYHGLYASHPRNDQRLKKVISTAGDLDLDTYIEDPSNPGEFKRRMEGLVWGESMQSERAENRYYHSKLEFTFEHPPQWSVKADSSAIVASAPDGSAQLTVTVRRREQGATPRSILEGGTRGTLSIGKELDQAGLEGYSAVASNGSVSKRLAVINYGNLSYLLEGEADDFASADAQLMAIVESFRPTHPREKQAARGQYLHYIQVPRGATMASLAAGINSPNAEMQLRLINGLYPSGEPRTGDWIKTIKQGN